MVNMVYITFIHSTKSNWCSYDDHSLSSLLQQQQKKILERRKNIQQAPCHLSVCPCLIDSRWQASWLLVLHRREWQSEKKNTCSSVAQGTPVPAKQSSTCGCSWMQPLCVPDCQNPDNGGGMQQEGMVAMLHIIRLTSLMVAARWKHPKHHLLTGNPTSYRIWSIRRTSRLWSRERLWTDGIVITCSQNTQIKRTT